MGSYEVSVEFKTAAYRDVGGFESLLVALAGFQPDGFWDSNHEAGTRCGMWSLTGTAEDAKALCERLERSGIKPTCEDFTPTPLEETGDLVLTMWSDLQRHLEHADHGCGEPGTPARDMVDRLVAHAKRVRRGLGQLITHQRRLDFHRGANALFFAASVEGLAHEEYDTEDALASETQLLGFIHQFCELADQRNAPDSLQDLAGYVGPNEADSGDDDDEDSGEEWKDGGVS